MNILTTDCLMQYCVTVLNGANRSIVHRLDIPDGINKNEKNAIQIVACDCLS